MKLSNDEVRELARLMNAARSVDGGPTFGLCVRFASPADAERGFELLAKQGRNPSRVNPTTVSANGR